MGACIIDQQFSVKMHIVLVEQTIRDLLVYMVEEEREQHCEYT